MIHVTARADDNAQNFIKISGAICLALLTGCSGEEVVEQEPVVRPAILHEIEAASDIQSVSLPAVIRANESVDITFQVGGLLSELPVTSGQDIAQGELIGRLDQRDFQNNVATAQAQFDTADSEYRRAERLVAENAISRSVYEQRKAQRDVTRAALDSALKNLEDATLRSPFAGIVARVQADQFQNVGPQEPIITLQTSEGARAEVQIPARLVATSGQITPQETVVILDAAPDVRIPATFASIATEADEQTQTFLTKFAFDPPDDLVILPGMTGTVNFKGRRNDSGGDPNTEISVPLTAVFVDGGDEYVWLVDQDAMTVSKKSVVVGSGLGSTVRIVQGLNAGDLIVGSGVSFLHEGMQIRPYEQ